MRAGVFNLGFGEIILASHDLKSGLLGGLEKYRVGLVGSANLSFRSNFLAWLLILYDSCFTVRKHSGLGKWMNLMSGTVLLHRPIIVIVWGHILNFREQQHNAA